MRFNVVSTLIALFVICPYHNAPAQTAAQPVMVLVPEGQFEMGDHHNYVDPAHPSDESPVRISPLYMG